RRPSLPKAFGAAVLNGEIAMSSHRRHSMAVQDVARSMAVQDVARLSPWARAWSTHRLGCAWICLVALVAPAIVGAQPVPLQPVVAVDAGGGHSCAALEGGGVRCWGYNNLAQLGDDSRTDRLLPVRVVDLTQPVTALGLGEVHSCAVAQGGIVSCWGMNFY